MPLERGRHDHLRHRPVLPAHHAAEPGGVRSRPCERGTCATSDVGARGPRRVGACGAAAEDGSHLGRAGHRRQHPVGARGHAPGDQSAVPHELLVSRLGRAGRRRRQDRHRPVGRERPRSSDARVVRLLRSVRAARARPFGLCRAGRAVRGGGGADRRRHHQVLSGQLGLHPGAVTRRIDRLQAALVAMLAALGVMTVFSARADWPRQIVWLAAGAGIYVAATVFDYRRLRAVAPVLYAGMMLMLVGVHLVGHTALGARRWLAVAGFPLEPSELSKLILVVVLAAYLARSERIGWRSFAGALGLAAAPAALVVTQPDLGTTLVLAAVTLGMLFLGGARPAQLLSVLAAVLVMVPSLPNLLRGYQQRRLEVFLNPNLDPLGAGYNLLQARIAVGSGGMFGRGWLHGMQGQPGFIPELATDFVFATLAEEFGLLGSLVLLTLFGTLVIRVLRSAAVAPDRFGELLAGGGVTVILVPVPENGGVDIRPLPSGRIPLPPVLVGGSATITTLAGLGIVQSATVRP